MYQLINNMSYCNSLIRVFCWEFSMSSLLSMWKKKPNDVSAWVTSTYTFVITHDCTTYIHVFSACYNFYASFSYAHLYQRYEQRDGYSESIKPPPYVVAYVRLTVMCLFLRRRYSHGHHASAFSKRWNANLRLWAPDNFDRNAHKNLVHWEQLNFFTNKKKTNKKMLHCEVIK